MRPFRDLLDSVRGGHRRRGSTGLVFSMEAIFLALLAVTGISSCPRKCQCIWRDSKITVDCSDQELAAIPTTVEANTQVRIPVDFFMWVALFISFPTRCITFMYLSYKQRYCNFYKLGLFWPQ